MKPLNLLSFIESFSLDEFDSYKEYLGINIKEVEKDTLCHFVSKMIEFSTPINLLEPYYFGYSIPRISKEFDLLRFSKESIINIEIKSEYNEKKIKEQLIKNKFYLSHIGVPLNLFSYVKDINKLYLLDENNALVETDFEYLKVKLLEQENIKTPNLDDVFKPSKYLVSPFNNTERFLKEEYFLTDQQVSFSEQLENQLDNSKGTILKVEGTAGTGKTLLAYHIAKKQKEKGKKVIILHTGKLNNGHDSLKSEGFNIMMPVDFVRKIESDLIDVPDLLIVDESQRLHLSQTEKIISYIKVNNVNCIFSYDPKQTLDDSEAKSGVVSAIENASIFKYILTNSIRTNENIIGFVDKFFNNRKYGNKRFSFNNIKILYFSNMNNAKLYINSQESCFINMTPSKHNRTYRSELETASICVGNSHTVIGQEFEKVIVLISKGFYYNDEGVLCFNKILEPTNYDTISMLYQSLSRAQENLELVVVDNPGFLKKVIDIIEI